MVSRMRDRIDGWWNVSSTADDLETSYFFSGSSSSNLASIAMLRHREGYFLLDRAFPLIEGHPRFREVEKRASHPSVLHVFRRNPALRDSARDCGREPDVHGRRGTATAARRYG